MLTHLSIHNYALIRELEIDFGAGFSVITGETGAGKSIILGALALVMGSRADIHAIADGEQKCIIEAVFRQQATGNRQQVTELIIRRELHSSGRSRSFVNDEVVTLAELKDYARRLLDIHSQHENLLIEDALFQLELVDALAHNEAERMHYGEAYTAYTQAREALATLEEQARKAREEADYITYRYEQLDEANIEAGEMEQLEEEQYRLSHAEQIRTALETACAVLDGDEQSVVSMLGVCRIADASEELDERIRSTEIEVRDIARDIDRLSSQYEADPQRLAWVEERMGTLYALQRKFGADSPEALIAMRDELAQQVGRLDAYDDEISAARKALTAAQEAMQQAALALRRAREAIGPQIAQELVEGLHQLGVAHPKIEISVTPLPDYQETGGDDVQILFAANLNQSLRPVRDVASGGEISRLMLCIKSLLADHNGLPTILFDEIDTGVSGEIATQMGRIMRRMADTRQIITITHLPQIAAQGSAHYRVYKADSEDRTLTHITRLSEEERVTEIATMLSGHQPSEAAMLNARQLLCCH